MELVKLIYNKTQTHDLQVPLLYVAGNVSATSIGQPARTVSDARTLRWRLEMRLYHGHVTEFCVVVYR